MTSHRVAQALMLFGAMELSGVSEVRISRPCETPEVKRSNEEIAAKLREERQRRKRENFEKRQPKGKA